MDTKQLFEKHPQWQAIVSTAQKLSSSGFKVYLAGGCVRDALMGRAPHDFDIATSAKPDEVKEIFPQAIDVGRAFGVMIIPCEGFQIEVATFRKDGDYQDGRHPEAVEFSEPETDAQRRDFTVNGLFYDLVSGQIIDYVSGIPDIQKKVIRAIGDPALRFKEDKLRMLRAARFAAQLGFDVEPNTLSAISKYKAEISVVSKERITEEFKKLSRSQDPIKGFVVLKATGLIENIFPQFGFYNTDYWGHFLRSQADISHIASLEILIACMVLFEGLSLSHGGSDFSEAALKLNWDKLPFVLSRESKREVEFLIHGFFAVKSGRDEALLLLNEETGPLLTELCFVFSGLQLFPANKTGELIDRFLKVADTHGHLPQPFISGEELIKLGVKPSPQMGELLRQNYMAQIKGELVSKSEALAWVKKRIKT